MSRSTKRVAVIAALALVAGLSVLTAGSPAASQAPAEPTPPTLEAITLPEGYAAARRRRPAPAVSPAYNPGAEVATNPIPNDGVEGRSPGHSPSRSSALDGRIQVTAHDRLPGPGHRPDRGLRLPGRRLHLHRVAHRPEHHPHLGSLRLSPGHARATTRRDHRVLPWPQRQHRSLRLVLRDPGVRAERVDRRTTTSTPTGPLVQLDCTHRRHGRLVRLLQPRGPDGAAPHAGPGPGLSRGPAASAPCGAWATASRPRRRRWSSTTSTPSVASPARPSTRNRTACGGPCGMAIHSYGNNHGTGPHVPYNHASADHQCPVRADRGHRRRQRPRLNRSPRRLRPRRRTGPRDHRLRGRRR